MPAPDLVRACRLRCALLLPLLCAQRSLGIALPCTPLPPAPQELCEYDDLDTCVALGALASIKALLPHVLRDLSGLPAVSERREAAWREGGRESLG